MTTIAAVGRVDDAAPRIATGRVVQISVSRGGVPKLPVEHAYVDRYGLEGDAHHDATEHGGPDRAVCLFGIEVIERLQGEGHPIEPGSAGENLTTSGIEWSLLPIGALINVGAELRLELSSSTTPCATQTGNFRGGNFNRILIDKHPSDSRMYARVVREGVVRRGDEISVFAPPRDSTAVDEQLLKRLERAEAKSSIAAWKAAHEAGFAIDIVEDGELALSASTDLPGPAFNQASGFARMPHMLRLATDFYDRHAAVGHIWLAEQPWPDAKVTLELEFLGATPAEITDFPAPAGVVIRQLAPNEGATYTRVKSGNAVPGGLTASAPDPWPDVYARLARAHARHLFIAEIDGVPVANASLHISAKTGWLRGAFVAPEARGRGIQQALIAARAGAAAVAGCDLVGASAEAGDTSARNLQQMGMRMLGRRTSYEYVPGSR